MGQKIPSAQRDTLRSQVGGPQTEEDDEGSPGGLAYGERS